MSYTLFVGGNVCASSLSLEWIKREAVLFHCRFNRGKVFILPHSED